MLDELWVIKSPSRGTSDMHWSKTYWTILMILFDQSCPSPCPTTVSLDALEIAIKISAGRESSQQDSRLNRANVTAASTNLVEHLHA